MKRAVLCTLALVFVTIFSFIVPLARPVNAYPSTEPRPNVPVTKLPYPVFDVFEKYPGYFIASIQWWENMTPNEEKLWNEKVAAIEVGWLFHPERLPYKWVFPR
jgi:hypothetical protein